MTSNFEALATLQSKEPLIPSPWMGSATPWESPSPTPKTTSPARKTPSPSPSGSPANAAGSAAKRTEVKVYLSAPEREQLDTEAARLAISRGQLIRDRALGAAPPPPANPEVYARAVERAARVVSGVPRPHLEAIVASVVTTLHSA